MWSSVDAGIANFFAPYFFTKCCHISPAFG
jgi:hypothetical protein